MQPNNITVDIALTDIGAIATREARQTQGAVAQGSRANSGSQASNTLSQDANLSQNAKASNTKNITVTTPEGNGKPVDEFRVTFTASGLTAAAGGVIGQDMGSSQGASGSIQTANEDGDTVEVSDAAMLAQTTETEETPEDAASSTQPGVEEDQAENTPDETTIAGSEEEDRALAAAALLEAMPGANLSASGPLVEAAFRPAIELFSTDHLRPGSIPGGRHLVNSLVNPLGIVDGVQSPVLEAFVQSREQTGNSESSEPPPEGAASLPGTSSPLQTQKRPPAVVEPAPPGIPVKTPEFGRRTPPRLSHEAPLMFSRKFGGQSDDFSPALPAGTPLGIGGPGLGPSSHQLVTAPPVSIPTLLSMPPLFFPLGNLFPANESPEFPAGIEV